MSVDAADLIEAEDAHQGDHRPNYERLEGIAARARAEADEAEAEQVDDPEPAHPVGDEEDTEATGEPAMIVCPFCQVGKVDADEALEKLGRIAALVQPFKSSPRYRTCPECEGWGTVFTGAKLAEKSIIPCPRCDSQGYIAAEPRQALHDGIVEIPTADDDPDGEWVDPLSVSPELGGTAPAVGMAWNPQLGRWEYPARP